MADYCARWICPAIAIAVAIGGLGLSGCKSVSARPAAATAAGNDLKIDHWGNSAWIVTEEKTADEGRRCEISQGPVRLTIIQGQIFELALDYDQGSEIDGYVPNRTVTEISIDNRHFVVENVEQRYTRGSGGITLPTRRVRTVFRDAGSREVEMTKIVALMEQSRAMSIKMRNGTIASVDLRGVRQIIRRCSAIS